MGLDTNFVISIILLGVTVVVAILLSVNLFRKSKEEKE
jgi:hypothetical protein